MKALRFIALALLVAGCAGRSGTSAMPKPGKGIEEYREVARQAHRAVANAVESLERLGEGAGLGRFDRDFENLELTSVKARARAEAIIARGQGYFDEWKEQLAVATNKPSAQANYDRMYEHFTRVRERSGEVRQEFRPFMAKLRHFRATLDHSTNSPSSESSRVEIVALAASGRRVLKTLDSVSMALNEAEVELHAMRNSK